MLNRRCATGLITAIALLGGTVAAHAQSYPAKPIRWVVPYPAGGGSDFWRAPSASNCRSRSASP